MRTCPHRYRERFCGLLTSLHLVPRNGQDHGTLVHAVGGCGHVLYCFRCFCLVSHSPAFILHQGSPLPHTRLTSGFLFGRSVNNFLITGPKVGRSCTLPAFYPLGSLIELFWGQEKRLGTSHSEIQHCLLVVVFVAPAVVPRTSDMEATSYTPGWFLTGKLFEFCLLPDPT